jgi:hypothetical protein
MHDCDLCRNHKPVYDLPQGVGEMWLRPAVGSCMHIKPIKVRVIKLERDKFAWVLVDNNDPHILTRLGTNDVAYGSLVRAKLVPAD